MSNPLDDFPNARVGDIWERRTVAFTETFEIALKDNKVSVHLIKYQLRSDLPIQKDMWLENQHFFKKEDMFFIYNKNDLEKQQILENFSRLSLITD